MDLTLAQHTGNVLVNVNHLYDKSDNFFLSSWAHNRAKLYGCR
jgi:hypothetical protein